MPAAPPVAYATLAEPVPSKPYILGITPTSLTGHLVLDHGSAELTVADAQTLKAVDVLKGQHSQTITGVRAEEGSIWSASKDASIVRWDERSRREAMTIKSFVRKPIPVTALEVSAADHLVIGGTELVSSEAHILFWDTRNAKEPAYRHSSTHSDDITHLSLLPPTATWQKSTPHRKLPGRLLLSAATDGCVALSDMRETDEEEAVQAEENWNESVAKAGSYLHKGTLRVWARSDMDNLASWTVGIGAEGELEFGKVAETPSSQFKFRDFDTPKTGPNVVLPVGTDKPYPAKLRTEYLIDAAPSLGVGKYGAPMVGIGTNDGNIVLQHSSNPGTYTPSAYFVTGPGPTRGHKDVVRCMYHVTRDEALYTGSEDGVLAGWSLASLPRLAVGDAEIDDDGGDGREDIRSEDEESEIETEESEESDKSDNEMDLDDDDEEPRYNPVIGRGVDKVEKRKEARKVKRPAPY